MKKFAALAVLAAVSASASAQSSMTVFGTMDANVGSVNNGSGSIKSVGSSGINSSKIGFRGTEDLGGGLQAGFWLEGGLLNDTGLGKGSGGGLIFQRRSTVSLISQDLGEVRLGRDWTPNYNNQIDFDPFGTNGVGSVLNLVVLNNSINGAALPSANTSVLGSGATTLLQAANSVGYLLPSNLGGVYGQAMVAPGEGTAGGKYFGGRLGYKSGPLNVAVSYGKTSALGVTTAGAPALGNNDLKETIVAGSYDFGVAKLMGQYGQHTFDNNALGFSTTQKHWMIGATAPVGHGTAKLSYSEVAISSNNPAAYAQYDTAGNINGLGTGNAHMLAVGYVYDLSKRTALYASYSRLTNGAGTRFSVGAQGNGPAWVGGQTEFNSSGYEIGIRHFF